MRLFPERFPKGTYPGQQKDGYPLSDVTIRNLEFIRHRVMKKNDDWCFGFDGRVSTGKTTLALQVMNYLDPNFSLDKVAFSPTQFLEILKNAKKGDAVLFDEAYAIGSRYAMSEFNKQVINIMSQIRSRNLFIGFILPSFFDLDKTLSLHRLDALFHCYKNKSGQKGYYSMFFEDKIKELYLKGKKFYNYSFPKANYNSSFSSCFVLNFNAYENKKQMETGKVIIKGKKNEERWKRQRDNAIKYLREKVGMKLNEITEAIGEIGAPQVDEIINYA